MNRLAPFDEVDVTNLEQVFVVINQVASHSLVKLTGLDFKGSRHTFLLALRRGLIMCRDGRTVKVLVRLTTPSGELPILAIMCVNRTGVMDDGRRVVHLAALQDG